MIRFVWLTAVKDLARRRRDPLSMAGWIGIPVVITLLLRLAVGGSGGGRPQGLLLVADEDSSFASNFLFGAFRQGPLAEMITAEKVDQTSGRQRLRQGEASALLIIPKDFGNAFLASRPTVLRLLTNPAQRILPNIIEETLSILVEAGFYYQQLPGDRLPLLLRLSSYVNPPLLRLETQIEESGPQFNFADAFFPGMLLLGVLFAAQGLGADLWRERDLGTLRRVAATPQSLTAFLAGKTLAAALLMAVIGAAGLAVGRWLLGLQIARPVWALLWLAASGAAYFLLMALVQLAASSARTGNMLAAVVVFPSAMIGGSFFPFEIMPAGLARIGRWTPNGWILTQLQALLSGQPHPAAPVILAAAGTLVFLLLLRRLHRIV
jgi:ABC-type multidrug transport system permease subunit